jgi:hypothetical protein
MEAMTHGATVACGLSWVYLSPSEEKMARNRKPTDAEMQAFQGRLRASENPYEACPVCGYAIDLRYALLNRQIRGGLVTGKWVVFVECDHDVGLLDGRRRAAHNPLCSGSIYWEIT